MIAIIAGGERNVELFGLDEHLPLPLFPLVDRPLLHHIIEYLVALGIRRFEFVLNHLPDKVESQLGDGARWGCSFCFHLFPSGGSPYKLAQTIAAGVDDLILLGRADRLPEFQLPAECDPAVYVTPDNQWTGWAVLPARSTCLAELDRDGTAESLLQAFPQVFVPNLVSFENGTGMLQAQARLLEGSFSGLMIGGRQTEPGIWISRNVSLHPTARLEAPVYVGANSRIGRGARIGPFAVIGDNCIVGDHSSVCNSSVAPGTYIGEALELEQVIVDRNRLINVKIGTSFLVSETFLLGSLTEQASHRPVQQVICRIVALFLLLLFSPAAALWFLYKKLNGRVTSFHQDAVKIPADNNPAGWRDYVRPRFRLTSSASRWAIFFSELWPGLIAVMRGDLFLVGVRPRTRSEIEQLPNDWKSIYLKSKGGLITEAAVMFGETPSEDELYTAEAYYSATESFRHDLLLFSRYFWKLIAGSPAPGIDLAQDHNT
jgi:hypothetical protein